MRGHHDWFSALAGELHRRGVPPETARGVLAEAAAHLRESGGHPVRVFGSPAAYATAVADSVGRPRRPAGDVLLEVRGLTKRLGRRTVLDGVDLTVRAGEIAAVVGANGCGKSTFLRACAGLSRVDTGEVRVHGTLGYCPQDGGTADFLVPDEHFVLVGAGRGMARGDAIGTGRRRAADLDWDPRDAGQARHLSGGTRQKLNLLLATLGEPDVLLLDEPYQGFDRGTYLDFWQLLWRWRDAGKAVVVVTHLLDRIDDVDLVLDLTPARRAVA
ncbi:MULTISPECIES: ATP-binding cassette domain-containing protein [Amycolatopsis]|uniref:ABC transporter n=2 Tax=Amycolatopsis TaxID=1813 RepID=A0A1I3JRW4_9PSEU|nr:ATP-binding cassette domain-containing protein [Amycolatopsis sacchari]SFI62924.1 ABC transporter [Amycolatopsis sacchari]